MSLFCGRWFLLLKIVVLRVLMAMGMKFHHSADPKSPKPNFEIVIPSRLSEKSGKVKLVFYLPDGYFEAPKGYKYPVVVNFHGGGFALGTATDDAKWASLVVKNVNAVFVSVEYRLAPKYPFSVGLEDGTDAIIYLSSHDKELKLDSNRIALSGFSAGGNFAFAIPLMLWDLNNGMDKRFLRGTDKIQQTTNVPIRYLSSAKTVDKIKKLEPTELETNQKLPDLTLKCIVSFYPPIDFRKSRKQKRAANKKPEKHLPPFLTNLFDQSYRYPQDKIDISDPYLSPAAASDQFLQAAYPDDIVLYTCEYDMLNSEGIAFGERLSSAQVGKRVHGGMIEGVVHAFDKLPNPKKQFNKAEKCYNEACAVLINIFGDEVKMEESQKDDATIEDRSSTESKTEDAIDSKDVDNEQKDSNESATSISN